MVSSKIHPHAFVYPGLGYIIGSTLAKSSFNALQPTGIWYGIKRLPDVKSR
jgi:hypothetical protein